VDGGPAAGAEPRSVGLRKAIEDLAGVYRELTATHAKTVPDLQLDQDRRQIAVAEAVLEELRLQVFAWEEWQKLLVNVREGRIAADAAPNPLLKHLPLGKARPASAGTSAPPVPVETDHFFPRFERTVGLMEQFARRCIRQAIPELLHSLQVRILPQRNELAGALTESAERRVEQMGEEAQMQYQILQLALSPEQLAQGLIKECLFDENSPATMSAAALFPLARSEKAPESDQLLRPGRFLGWHPELRQRSDQHEARLPDNASHPIQVMRLRNEMVITLGQALTQLVSQSSQLVFQKLLEIWNAIVIALGNLLLNNQLILTLAESGQEQPGRPRRWAGLAAIPAPAL
jgi:hypothetical protein